MQEHVGKKRRKEVREAIDLRNEMKSSIAFISVIIVVGAVIAVGVQVLGMQGIISYDDLMMQVVPMAILFVMLMIVGSRAYKWSGLREQYKEHCKKYNITKDDMRALERGEMR